MMVKRQLFTIRRTPGLPVRRTARRFTLMVLIPAPLMPLRNQKRILQIRCRTNPLVNQGTLSLGTAEQGTLTSWIVGLLSLMLMWRMFQLLIRGTRFMTVGLVCMISSILIRCRTC